jgi:amidophosphoribosyltransferase
LRLKEKCGVFGAYSKQNDVFPLLYWGMISQNHRGHQSYGFATYNDHSIDIITDLGIIPNNNQSRGNSFQQLFGNVGIANVRYATSGPQEVEALKSNAMPILIEEGNRSIAISFNGNVVNVRQLQKKVGLKADKSDTHAISFLLLRTLIETNCLEEAARECMRYIDGSFSIVGISDSGDLFAFKDPYGVKPLCYGRGKDIHAFSSESVGLDINGLEFVKELKPGELMIVKDGEVINKQIISSKNEAMCSFEFAYFARPDSRLNGRYVYQARRDFGAALARVFKDKADRCDIVLSLPETANDAAYGFHEETGIPWDMSTRRHRYVTQRAFITQEDERDKVIFRKINILTEEIEGKNLAVVDDSIVRGDTTKSIIQRLKKAGAGEIHLFITFPRIIAPCFYGINMATFGELIGARNSVDEIADELGIDSLNYLPIEEYVKATGMKHNSLCTACITSKYPTPLAQKLSQKMKERILEGEKEVGRIYE